jgi:hypothetical protein
LSSSNTRYTARFQLPELIERGRAELLTCPVFLNDQLQLPTAGTATVYDATGTALATPAVTFPGSIATATLPGATTTALAFAEGWRVEWSLTMPDGVVHLFRNDAALVRYRLYPTITGLDVSRRLRALDPTLPAVITTRTTFQDAIDEADVELQLRLIERGRRPWCLATPSALRMSWLHLTIAIVLESLAVQNPALVDAAVTWRKRFEDSFATASAQFDYDQDGIVGTSERESIKRMGTWLC